jgi:hypothetical protein
MRILIFLSLLITFFSCDLKDGISNPEKVLNVRPLSFSGLAPVSIRISHPNDDTLYFVDEAGTTLSKFSLVDQSLIQGALDSLRRRK